MSAGESGQAINGEGNPASESTQHCGMTVVGFGCSQRLAGQSSIVPEAGLALQVHEGELLLLAGCMRQLDNRTRTSL